MDLKLINDLVIENGDLVLVEGSTAAAQRIRHRLLTFRGEWFLDLVFGPTYREDILIKNPRLDVVTAVIKSEILKSADGDFEDFEASLDAQRHLEMRYTLNLEGETFTETITL